MSVVLDVRNRSCKEQNMFWLKAKMRQPGVEPGSIAWKATMLTATPPTLDGNMKAMKYFASVGS